MNSNLVKVRQHALATSNIIVIVLASSEVAGGGIDNQITLDIDFRIKFYEGEVVGFGFTSELVK